ncbi:MAG: ion channel [Acidobacteriota bacterium]
MQGEQTAKSWYLTGKHAPWPGIVALIAIAIYLIWGKDATSVGKLSWGRVAAGALLSISVIADFALLTIKGAQARFGGRLALGEVVKVILLIAYNTKAMSDNWALGWGLAAMTAGVLIAVATASAADTLLPSRNRATSPATQRQARAAPATTTPPSPSGTNHTPESEGESSTTTSRDVARGTTQPGDLTFDELRRYKLVALGAVFISFLHVTYCFSFALAISDSHRKRDLYPVRIPQPQLPTKADKDGPSKPTSASACDKTQLGEIQTLMFRQSEGALPCTSALYDLLEATKRQGVVCKIVTDFSDGRDILNKEEVPACGDANTELGKEMRRTAMWNLRQLYQLRELLIAESKPSDDKKQRRSLLIEIRGHANEINVKDQPRLSYASNFEISQQRAEQAMILLNRVFFDSELTDLQQPPIRWLYYGVTDKSEFFERHEPQPKDETDVDDDWPEEVRMSDREPRRPNSESDRLKKLSVEIRVQRFPDSFSDRRLRDSVAPERELNLIDYLYFATYTITTTGYGDIIPTSTFAKVVVTLANLLELLYIAVIFQIVASARERRHKLFGRRSRR